MILPQIGAFFYFGLPCLVVLLQNYSNPKAVLIY
jgi:hypothetical protein